MVYNKSVVKKGLVIVGFLVVVVVLALLFLRAQSGSSRSTINRLGITKSKEEGLVAYWNFDEGGGQTLEDLSGNGFDGVIKEAAWVEGIDGHALAFDGNDDIVEINSAGRDSVGVLEYGTISIWFKFKSIGTKTFLPMLYLGEANAQERISGLVIEIGHFDHGRSPDQKLYYTLYNDRFEPILCFDSNQNLQENTWYHFAVVNSPSGNTGYLNGVELTNRHYNFSNAADTRFFAILSNKDTFQLGYGWFGIDQKFHYFNGVIDEVKIYNRPLSSDEISSLANL